MTSLKHTNRFRIWQAKHKASDTAVPTSIQCIISQKKIKGNPKADTIDVYEALDMFLPGLFAHFSVLDGGVPKEIPNLRDKAVRDLWRNNTACTDPKAAGDMLLPSYSKGNPNIDSAIYEKTRKKWEEDNKS